MILSLSQRFIFILMTTLLVTVCPALAEEKKETEKPPIKQETITEIIENSDLSEQATRLIDRAGYEDTIEWLQKEIKIKDDHRMLSKKSLDQILEKATSPIEKSQRYIGLINMRQGGFEKDLWKNYKENDFKNDFDVLGKTTLLPSQQDILRRVLITEGKKPVYFRTESDFSAHRIRSLLSLGFNQEAVNLYGATLTQIKLRNIDLALSGIEALILNNKFDAACLEEKLFNKKEKDELSLDIQEWLSFLNVACKSYLNDPLPKSENLSFESAKSLLSALEQTNKTFSVLGMENPHLYKSIPLLIALSQQGKLTFNIDHITSISSDKGYMVALALHPDLSIKSKITAVKNALKYDLLTPKQLETLFEETNRFIDIAKQTYFKKIRSEGSAKKKIALIQKQILKNGNPASHESNLYKRDLLSIKSNESFNDFAPFIYSYLALNGEISASEKWLKRLDEEEKSPKNLDFPETIEKKSFFFIFPLYSWQKIMLKEYVETPPKRKRFDTRSTKSVANSLLSKEFKALLEGQLESFDAYTQRLLRRYKRAVLLKDRAQVALLSILLLETDKKPLKEENNTASILVDIVLQGLVEADLKNYALGLGRDLLSQE